jgi:hypothetical protein
VAIEQVDQTTVTQAPVAGADEAAVRTDTHRISRMSPGRNELARRIVVLVFGLIQIVIGARIVLLLFDAREANPIVSAILNVSQIFVAPFEGVLGTDSLNAAGSVLDIAAVVALVGWTIVELIVIWALGIFRREPV